MCHNSRDLTSHKSQVVQVVREAESLRSLRLSLLSLRTRPARTRRPRRSRGPSGCWRGSSRRPRPRTKRAVTWRLASSSSPPRASRPSNFETTRGRPTEERLLLKEKKEMQKKQKESNRIANIESIWKKPWDQGTGHNLDRTGAQLAWMRPHVFCNNLRFWLMRKFASWQVGISVHIAVQFRTKSMAWLCLSCLSCLRALPWTCTLLPGTTCTLASKI